MGKSDQAIHCRLEEKSKGQPRHISMVYASNCFQERKKFWDDLNALFLGSNVPWMIMGNFNDVRKRNETVKGS